MRRTNTRAYYVRLRPIYSGISLEIENIYNLTPEAVLPKLELDIRTISKRIKVSTHGEFK